MTGDSDTVLTLTVGQTAASEEQPGCTANEAETETPSSPNTATTAQEETGADGADASDKKKGGARKPRLRTSALREQNSRAQKRYRERQKLRKSAMEYELMALRERADQVAAAEARTEDLRKRYEKLEQQQRKREAEAGGSEAPADPTAGLHLRPICVTDKVEEIRSVEDTWLLQLNRFMACVSAPGKLTEEQQQEYLSEANALASKLQAVTSVGLAWMHSLLVADLDIPWCMGSEAERVQARHWKKMAENLELKVEQKEMLSTMRDDILFRLDNLYMVRRMLGNNIEALGKSWVHMIREATNNKKMDMARKVSMSADQVVSMLGSLKDNLNAEHSAVIAFNTAFIQKVLYPYQAMRFLQMASHMNEYWRSLSGMPAPSLNATSSPPSNGPSSSLAFSG